ncbi:MAG: hypothetical protein WDN24_22355 [Sphingomonas sp.]
MGEQESRDSGTKRSDEVARLARRYLDDPGDDGLAEIDRHVTDAAAESRWDDVSKWHRVRLRYLRYRQQQDLARRQARPTD